MRLVVEELFHEVAELSAEARARFFAERAVDAAVRKEVEELLAFDSHTNRSLDEDITQVAQGALARSERTDIQCGPYKLGDVLGRGGMGTVHLGERVDGEVSQRVAIKLLRPGVDDSTILQRFLSERQILATLSHPNIARLLDVGHREDGQPYLVMEYVEGKPIDEHAARCGTRQKVALFLKVCAAVSYLHRNLVVHRDLKPSNILVDTEGEPKLLDFGIAKILDLNADSTMTSIRMLTPDYASPEQVTGAQMTTATDIYSLGAVLYKLLTGASPHQFEGASSPAALALAISAGKIIPPSKLAPEVKSDLEMIVMKALRAEPDQRYETVEQVSEDLENYLASRAIRARKGDTWYQTRKFLRRHWLTAAATTLAVAGLAGGVLLANHQRAIAQRRFVQVRQLSNKLFDIDAEVRRTPGTTKARELIVSTSLEYLQRLSEDVEGDSDLAFELANAYLSVARLQGVPISLNLGHTDQADQSLQIAERLAASVLRSEPDNRKAVFLSAQIAQDRMILAVLRSRHGDVQKFGRQSEDLLTRYEQSGAVDPRDVEEVVRTYTNIGNSYASEPRWDDVIRLSRHAKELALAAGLSIRAGSALLNLAKALNSRGDLEEALQAVREAIRLLQAPGGKMSAGQSLALVAVLVREGEILCDETSISLGQPDEALVPFERAYAITESLVSQDPNDSESRARLPNASMPLALILRQRDPRRALALYDHTLARLGEAQSNERIRRKQVLALAASSYPLRSLGRNAEAQNRLDEAMAILRDLKLYPADKLRSESFETLLALAAHEGATGNAPSAIQRYEELLRKLQSADPNAEVNLDAAVDLTNVYAGYAGLQRRMGRMDLASALQGRRVELWRRWEARRPQNIFIHRQLEAANRPID